MQLSKLSIIPRRLRKRKSKNTKQHWNSSKSTVTQVHKLSVRVTKTATNVVTTLAVSENACRSCRWASSQRQPADRDFASHVTVIDQHRCLTDTDHHSDTPHVCGIEPSRSRGAAENIPHFRVGMVWKWIASMSEYGIPLR